MRYIDHTAQERRAPTAKFVQNSDRAESPIDGIRMPYLTNTEHNKHQIRVSGMGILMAVVIPQSIEPQNVVP